MKGTLLGEQPDEAKQGHREHLIVLGLCVFGRSKIGIKRRE